MKVHQLFNDGCTVPAAFVTKGRQRVKQYGKSVYLNNGDEFELELFNPTQNKVLAKIELNGVSLGSGIVLRPGERVFLERYLNEARKFLFETYVVNKNDENAMKAIADNGNVTVNFYNEYFNYGITYTSGCWRSNAPYWISPPSTVGPYYYSTSLQNLNNPVHGDIGPRIGGQGMTANNCTSDAGGTLTSSIFYASAGAPANNELEAKASMDMDPLETGRVEKGSNSNQCFTYDSTTFNTWWSWQSVWKILPLSQKPIVQEDLKIYCINCGTKQRKRTHLFCPNCGTKY